MIIVNVNSGLGNQMYHYALYLALKHYNKDQEVYMENSIFEICGKPKKYQLEEIFDLEIPKLENIINKKTYLNYINESKKISNTLPDNWLSKSAIMCRHLLLETLEKDGYSNFGQITDLVSNTTYNLKYETLLFLKRTPILADLFYRIKAKSNSYYNMREFYRSISRMINIKKYRLEDKSYLINIMRHKGGNWYYIGNFEDGTKYFHPVENEIKSAFTFPELDSINNKIAEKINDSESVSLHVRRGDHLVSNVNMERKDNYFIKSVNYIKSVVDKPEFFVFSDDIEWCKMNQSNLGLKKEDKIYFVDNNSGNDSYKDMQLMSLCKNNIIPISTFSWWASYLNKNPNKVVIAPKGYWANASIFL
ncbi:alpha-1,2-fucosyltransferase [Niallia sp. JL1B1071]|uniref:alpha-1,2-fucosyltransferase n=1 Tax=Niallia tiangongensis TaxID=3237105 RepID=UPI0037DC727A